MTAFTMTALSSETEPHDQDTTTTEGFSVLSNLDLDDCCSLDPSLFANVTLGDLDAWLQDSLKEVKDDLNLTSKVAEVGRRLSMCLGAEIQRRHSLFLGSQGNGAASRRGSTFSEFGFNPDIFQSNSRSSGIETMSEGPHQELSHLHPSEFTTSTLPCEPVELSNEGAQQQHDTFLSSGSSSNKRRRVDHSQEPTLEKLCSTSPATSHSYIPAGNATMGSSYPIQQQTNANLQPSFAPQNKIKTSLGSSTNSIIPPYQVNAALETSFGAVGSIEPLPAMTRPFVDSSLSASYVNEFLRIHTWKQTANKKGTHSAPTPVVPLMSIVNGLSTSMVESEQSQQDIHDWDRSMGLRRSHSKTMRATGRSRKKLQELQKQFWHCDVKQYGAKGA